MCLFNLLARNKKVNNNLITNKLKEMRNKLLIVALAVVSAVALTNCSPQMNMDLISGRKQVKSVGVVRSPEQRFLDLTNGLEVNVIPTQPDVEQEYEGLRCTYHLSGKNYFIKPTVQYIRSMGFTEMYAPTDYRLNLTIISADVTPSNNRSSVEIEVALQDRKGNELFSQKNILISVESSFGNYGLDEAYTQALEEIRWGRIASFLRTEELAKEEPKKVVQGLGDTALEHTILRWDIQSRPQGADIFWRVVSKTPEVKSTNNKYLMTTPYEATKALDIRGLTYQTSGNVRIILRCEKDGYMPQEKEFDVRMALDQEEISAFFRLVKEEE